MWCPYVGQVMEIHKLGVGGWTAHSGPTYTSAGTLGHPYITFLSAGPLIAVTHICWLAHLEYPYILSLLAGLLIAVVHIV